MFEKIMERVGRILPPLLVVLCITASFTLSPALRANAQTWVNGFVRDVNGLLMVNCTNCNAGSGVQTVTAGAANITIGGTTANPTVALNYAYPNGWTNVQGFNGTAGNCTNSPTTLYGLCIGEGNGTTNNIGIAIGPQGASGWGCSTACTTSNSAQLCLYGESSTGPLSQCLFVDTTGVLNLSKMKISNSFDMGANPVKNTTKVGTYAACSGTGSFTGTANNNESCMVTLSAGTATWTFGTAYSSAPVPVCTDTTAANPVKCSATTTAVSITGTSADVIAVHVIGNGSV